MKCQWIWIIYVSASTLFTSVTLEEVINLFNSNQSSERKNVNPVINNIFNKTQLTFNDILGFFNEKCLENNAAAAKETIIKAFHAKEDLKLCVTSHFNTTIILHEIRTAPHGELDTVFKRYCDKRPILRKCITEFIATVQECMNEGILETTRNTRHVAETLIDFICIKEGDLIAQFYVDKGPECIKSKYDDIHKYCYNTTIAKYVPKKWFNLQNFTFESRECNALASFWRCSVERLESCDDSAAANVVGTMCQTIWELTPCYKPKDPLEYYRTFSKSPQTPIRNVSGIPSGDSNVIVSVSDVISEASRYATVNDEIQEYPSGCTNMCCVPRYSN